MAEVISKCPCCGGNIVETDKAFGCENWKDKEKPCDFTIWKTICKKKITRENAVDIITNGKSLLIEGFTGKSGKNFSAFLVLVDDCEKKCGKRVGFEFPEN